MGKLTGKTAVVTGASSGIGAAVAEHLANEGANVVLAARRKDKLDGVVSKINGNAIAVVTDMAKKSDVDDLAKRAIEEFGQVDIYVNNAGAVLGSRIQDGQTENWDQMIDTNIKGVLYGINSTLPGMLERSSGHVVNIASVSGLEVNKVSAVYSATKFAVHALSMSLEKELARTGVRVTNISPGQVDTAIASKPSDREPLKADDIAKAVVYAVTQPDYVNVNEITVRPV
ncbi:SDR family oxidoreductase [Virgibacillus necropolis]|uniref:Oxidoreductase n=1 Tax=Virgibacillus necropolis TaxID=163877 RepID=A0A221MED9_9BACI|nr:SDR family oxidoreductase [Virgibacillus necropolis]ASN05970.1 oxidoreductase [Virgibacillus necropolis]